MNEQIKVKNLEKAIKEITKMSKSNWLNIKLIETKEQEYYLIRTALIHWQFWYSPKEKIIEMERI